MNESEFNELRETSWRRKLMPAEELRAQAHLAAHPEAQTAWEEDLALTRQLQDLPNVRMSNAVLQLEMLGAPVEMVTRAEGRVPTRVFTRELLRESRWRH